MSEKLCFRYVLLLLVFTLTACFQSSTPKGLLPKVSLQVFQPNLSVLERSDALQQYAGSWLWVQFWATDCVACIEEMPGLIANHQEFSERGLKTLAVAMQHDSVADVQSYWKDRPIPADFKVMYDHQGQLGRDGLGQRIYATPTAVIISPEGKQMYRLVGAPNFVEVYQALDGLLPPKGQTSHKTAS